MSTLDDLQAECGHLTPRQAVLREVERAAAHLRFVEDAAKRAGLEPSAVHEAMQRQTLPSATAAREVRIAAGLSQQTAAAQIGVHRMTLNRWETGEREPLALLRDRYADALRRWAAASVEGQ